MVCSTKERQEKRMKRKHSLRKSMNQSANSDIKVPDERIGRAEEKEKKEEKEEESLRKALKNIPRTNEHKFLNQAPRTVDKDGLSPRLGNMEVPRARNKESLH